MPQPKVPLRSISNGVGPLPPPGRGNAELAARELRDPACKYLAIGGADQEHLAIGRHARKALGRRSADAWADRSESDQRHRYDYRKPHWLSQFLLVLLPLTRISGTGSSRGSANGWQRATLHTPSHSPRAAP